MDALKLTGVISGLSETKTFIGKDGNERYVRDMIVTTDEQYPKSVSVEIKRENLINLPLQNGSIVTVYLNPIVRFNKEGRAFNDIEAWKIEINN